MNTTCGCEEEKSIVLNTDDMYLKGDYCLSLPVLPNLNIFSRTCLTEILEKIDYEFAKSTNTLNFSTVNLPFIKTDISVINLKTFAEAVDLKLSEIVGRHGQLNGNFNNLQALTTSLLERIEDLENPNIIDSSNIGILVQDSLQEVLQKIVNSLNDNTFDETPILANDSSSIKFITSGTKNHTLTAHAKLSGNSGNVATIKSDGIYVAQSTSTPQTLNLNGNILAISEGNYVEIPVTGLQRLSLNSNVLGLTGVPETVILPSFTETALSVNSSTTIALSTSGTSTHTLSASVKISPSVGNQLIDSNGLYVKIGATEVLDEISSNANLYNNVFLDLVNNGVRIPNYRWNLKNNLSTSKSFEYLDVSGVIVTSTVSANTSVNIIGKRINSFDSDLIITFLGQ